MTTQLTNLLASDLEDFFKLLPRIFADYRDFRRGQLEMLYLFSQTPDNEDSVFLRAIEMANASMTKNIGIAEGEKGHGYEGFDRSVERLRALGWKDQVPIMQFNLDGNVNSRSEAIALTDYALAHRGDIGIIAPPFHIARAFMTTVSVIAAAPTRVYAYPGVSMPWNARVAHSQGTLVNTRSGLLVDELKRLEKYRAKECGGLFTAGQVLDYLDWRDS